MRLLISLSLLLAACAKSPAPAEAAATAPETEAPAAAPQHFGVAFTVEEVTPAGDLLSDPAPWVDKTVRVEGRVTDVCQKAGCWLVITDDTNHMRVRTKDHGFFVDKGATGATSQVEGVVVALPLNPDEVAHFASESTEGAVLPENKVTGEFTYEIVASAVELRR